MTTFKCAFSALVLALVPARAYDFSAVDRLVTDSLAAFGDSVVVVLKREDETLFHTRRGNLDTLSKLGIASATKWISGAVILRLAEKGLFNLDDSLGAYLPAFTENGKGAITLRQGFSMTSGLYGGKEFDLNPLMTLKRSVDSIAASTPLAFAPGTRMAYSGSGMQAVGRVAELVTGKPWAQIAKEEILGPCGMDSTTYDNMGPLNPAIAGGIRSTPQDYLRFLSMVMGNGMYRGRRVLSTASIAEMFRDQTHGVPILYSPWPRGPYAHPDGQPPRYAFGCWAMSTNAQTGLEDEIASPGYYGSFPWVDRCRGIYGIVFVHNPGEGGRSLAVATRILDLIRKEVGGCAVTALSPNPVWRATPDMVFPGLSLPGSPAGYLIDGRVIPASRP